MGYTCYCLWGGDRNNTEGEQTTKKWEADVHAKRNNTEGEQTTKKWETDVHAKRYERGRRLGEDN